MSRSIYKGLFFKVNLLKKKQWIKIYNKNLTILPEYIDHIDRNRINNKINNLRETTLQNNNRNRSQQKSSSGIKGIIWYKRDNKWLSYIKINNKRYNLGYYDNFDDAVLARYKKECEINWNKSEESPAYIYLKEKNLI